LVAVAYYIGSEKEYDGAFPFAILTCFTTVCMITSEIIARRKTKLSKLNHVPGHQRKNMVISNLIPFTRLNLIFAFGFFINAIIRVVQRTQIGFPNLSIQIVVMLISLLISNKEAKKHCKRTSATLRWMDSAFNCQNRVTPENISTNQHTEMTYRIQIDMPIPRHLKPNSPIPLHTS
jgi:hypothetical protein